MANHALRTPSPSWLQLLTLTYLRRLSRPRKAGLIVDLVWLGLLIPAVVQLLTGHWGVTIGLALSTLVASATQAVWKGREQEQDDWHAERNDDLMELLASGPGGAPLMADVTSHCGCVLRFAYDVKRVAWTPVGVIDSADSCLAMAR